MIRAALFHLIFPHILGFGKMGRCSRRKGQQAQRNGCKFIHVGEAVTDLSTPQERGLASVSKMDRMFT